MPSARDLVDWKDADGFFPEETIQRLLHADFRRYREALVFALLSRTLVVVSLMLIISRLGGEYLNFYVVLFAGIVCIGLDVYIVSRKIASATRVALTYDEHPHPR